MHMATRSPRTRRWTRADLERLPDDGNRYEVLNGNLFVTPQAAFDHQDIAGALLVALRTYCAQHEIGIVVGPGSSGRTSCSPTCRSFRSCLAAAGCVV